MHYPQTSKLSQSFQIRYIFTQFYPLIFPKSQSYFPVISKVFRAYSELFKTSDIELLMDEILRWGKSESVDEIIHQFSLSYPLTPGQDQLYHLAALAIGKDVNKLNTYLRGFENGDRLGFVPMITTGMIERALKLASDKC